MIGCMLGLETEATEGPCSLHPFLRQAFIDQLIEDKKGISQKCESLTVELRSAERRSRENLKAMESRHGMEMARIKQVTCWSCKAGQDQTGHRLVM